MKVSDLLKMGLFSCNNYDDEEDDDFIDNRRLRLEFNQEHCDYFTEIDAVYLHGVESEIEYNYSEEKEDSIVSITEAFHQRMSMNSNLNNENSYVRNDSVNISMLPVSYMHGMNQFNLTVRKSRIIFCKVAL